MAKFTLNPSQEKAVNHQVGPLLVVAGAGTGKTRIIAQRVRRLIEDEKVKSAEILAITFTDKASHEMLERVEDVMPLGYTEPWVCTFHSFADRVLRASGVELGIDTGYSIMSYPQQWAFVKQHLFDFELNYFLPLGNPAKFISAILKFVSRLQDEDVSPESLVAFAEKFSGDPEEKNRWCELANFYTKYSALKLIHSKMDFGDLITYCLKLFRERSSILHSYQTQFQHILVDEFQDTNYAQYELIKLLFPSDEDTRSLLVVGDDYQSIYKFRGAAVSNILEFKKDYPQAEMVTLTDNYRSFQKLLDASYKLIKHNDPDTLEFKLGLTKKLVAKVKFREPQLTAVEAENLEDEVRFVVAIINSLMARDSELKYKDIAILARANNHLDQFVLALRRAEIPYRLVGNRGLYDRDEIKNVLALINIMVNDNDPVSLYRVLCIESLGISQSLVHQMLNESKFKKIKLFDLVKASQSQEITSLLEKLTVAKDKVKDSLPSSILFELLSQLSYVEGYLQEETVENNLSVRNLNLFLDRVKEFERQFYSDIKTRPSLYDLSDYIEVMLEAGDNPAQAEIEDTDTVALSTVHSAKGLEFEAVFMVNLVASRFPSRDKGDVIEIPEQLIKEVLPEGDPHLQEERRLFYVGMTRAKKYLYLTYAKNYSGKRDNKMSGYIQETGIKILSVDEVLLAHEANQSSLFGPEAGYKSQNSIPAPYKLDYVSYSQIATYEKCPLQYKYSHVLKVPSVPSHSLSFGNTIHNTLREFHGKIANNQQVSLEDLKEIYDKHWDPIGYESIEHKTRRYASGVELLTNYIDYVKANPTQVLYLEESFNLRIEGVKFGGRIDRIDKLAGGTVEIIDYKTGKQKDQKEVDKDLQVGIYAWGAKEALNLDAEKLSLFFVEDLVKISTTRSASQIEENKKQVVEVIKKIKSGDFSAKPGMECKWCAYRDICPSAFKG